MQPGPFALQLKALELVPMDPRGTQGSVSAIGGAVQTLPCGGQSDCGQDS